MPVVRISIIDDDGSSIGKNKDYKLELDLEKMTLSEIEMQVENFRKKSLPEIEKQLLMTKQEKLVVGVKKTAP